MNGEYLLFNLLILSGPLALSFDQRVQFVRFWPRVFAAILPVSAMFLIWDILVSGSHWFFNPQFTLDVRLLGLPAGEWLFFLTVPYAALFVWEVLNSYFPRQFHSGNINLQILALLIMLMALPAFYFGKTYTALTLLALGFAILLDGFLKTGILQKRGSMGYFALVTLMMLIFNGYLTARPVVQYNIAYQLNVKILTIPIEDFGYGYALILMVTSIYEKLRRRFP